MANLNMSAGNDIAGLAGDSKLMTRQYHEIAQSQLIVGPRRSPPVTLKVT